MAGKLLFDDVIQDEGIFRLSSQCAEERTPANFDAWTGYWQPAISGFTRHEGTQRIQVYKSPGYSGRIPGCYANPNPTYYDSPPGQKSVTLKIYRDCNPLYTTGCALFMRRTADFTWKINFFTGWGNWTVYTDGSNDWYWPNAENPIFRVITTQPEPLDRFRQGDVCVCTAYQLQLRVSTDAGATWGGPVNVEPPDPPEWIEYGEYDLTLPSGLVLSCDFDDNLSPAAVGDYVDIITKYHHGRDALNSPRRDLRWKTKRGGYQCAMVPFDTAQTFNTLAALDMFEGTTLQLYTSSDSDLIGTCYGTFTTVGEISTLEISSGTFDTGIQFGKLWVTTGDGMGHWFYIASANAATKSVELTTPNGLNPADVGVEVGDVYIIAPTEAATLQTFTAESSDWIKHLTNTATATCAWIVLYHATRSSMDASILRLSNAVTVDAGPMYGTKKGFPGDIVSRSITGIVHSKASGYMQQKSRIVYSPLTATQYTAIKTAMDENLNPDRARFLLHVPRTDQSNKFEYGRIQEAISEQLNKQFYRIEIPVEYSPSDRRHP